MPQRCLNRLEPVYRADSDAEWDFADRFLDPSRANAPHPSRERRAEDRPWRQDPSSRETHAALLYTGEPKALSGAVRLHHWQAGAVPTAHWERLSMDLFPFLNRCTVGELGPLSIGPIGDGEACGAALLRESYRYLVGEKGCDLIFHGCAPGQVRSYRRFGLRPFGGRLQQSERGMCIPLVAIPSDLDFYQQVGSFLAPLANEIFGADRERLDPEPYRHLLCDAQSGIDLDRDSPPPSTHLPSRDSAQFK